jgi:hypothetical protein
MITSKAKKLLYLGAIVLNSLLFCSCSSNPLAIGYRSAPGVTKREWVNTNPTLAQPSISNHNGTVSSYTRKGYRVIGYGQMNARYEIDPQNARLLAIEKNGDVAVFSRRYLGKQTERVQVPIATVQSNDYSQYSNTNQYASQQSSGSQSTVYGYQDQQYQLWEHKTTLLRGN